jgi:hypothetical protein
MKQVFWCGHAPDVCQVCDAPLASRFVDGRTMWGPWANMCCDCHARCGEGVGTGKGQLYEKQTDGRWLKITSDTEHAVDRAEAEPSNTFPAELADVLPDPFVTRLLVIIDSDDFVDYPVTHDGDLDNPVQ